MKKIFTLISLLLSVGAAHAESANITSNPSAFLSASSPFAMVHSLMAQKQWQAAQLELQEVALNPNADPIEVLFLGGLIAIENQNYATAISQFQRILIDHPNITRARLELARAYFLSGDDDGAQFQFERVLASDLPVGVSANVQFFLAQIRSRRSWTFGFGFSLLPDSNVNQATSSQTVMIAGLPFTLSSDARQTSGVGFLWQLYGEKRWNIDDQWRIALSGNLLRKDYSKKQFNDTTVYSRIGPRYLFEGGDVGVGLSLSKRLLGDMPYNDAQGLFIDTNRQLGEHWLAQASLESQQFQFDTGKGSPGTLTSSFLKVRYLLSPVSLVEGGIDLSYDNTISQFALHQTTGISAGFRSEAPYGLGYGISLRSARTHYPVFQSFFNQYRDDELSSLSIDLTKRDWQFYGFAPVISVTKIKNNSGISLYNFERTMGQLGFNRQF
jgi:tetratricopeptide (TPR) repeat protein